jgi:hypothetical protein
VRPARRRGRKPAIAGAPSTVRRLLYAAAMRPATRPLLLVTFSLFFGCAGDSAPDERSDLLAGCEGARIDSHGFCRAPDGTFAKLECCGDAAACADARPDASGTCRHADGRFAATACCATLCVESKLDDAGRCRNADGRFAAAACCNDACVERDADEDVRATCEEPMSCESMRDLAEHACDIEPLMQWEDCFAEPELAKAEGCCVDDPFLPWCNDLGASGCKESSGRCARAEDGCTDHEQVRAGDGPGTQCPQTDSVCCEVKE